eukprot:3086488-Amphidinium_carterae.1
MLPFSLTWEQQERDGHWHIIVTCRIDTWSGMSVLPETDTLFVQNRMDTKIHTDIAWVVVLHQQKICVVLQEGAHQEARRCDDMYDSHP